MACRRTLNIGSAKKWEVLEVLEESFMLHDDPWLHSLVMGEAEQCGMGLTARGQRGERV